MISPEELGDIKARLAAISEGASFPVSDYFYWSRNHAREDVGRLLAEVERLQSNNDDLLFELVQMKQRLGQYEAQYAHDHNIWKATRIGQLKTDLERLNRHLKLFLDAPSASEFRRLQIQLRTS